MRGMKLQELVVIVAIVVVVVAVVVVDVVVYPRAFEDGVWGLSAYIRFT